MEDKKEELVCPFDCQDNLCKCAYPKTGQRTNGGCSCDRWTIQSALDWWRKKAIELYKKNNK
jgi:hypothetical protein